MHPWFNGVASRFECLATDGAEPTAYWFIYDLRSGVSIAGGDTLAKATEMASFLLTAEGVQERLAAYPEAVLMGGLFG
jgi:hypothetical protein